MANLKYDKAAEKFARGQLNWGTGAGGDTIKAALVKNTYTPNLATHEFHSSVSADVVGTPQTLANKTDTAGALDADDVAFTGLAGGNTLSYIEIYKDTGVAGTSPLIALIDTATNLPVTTTAGLTVNVAWDSGANKIIHL